MTGFIAKRIDFLLLATVLLTLLFLLSTQAQGRGGPAAAGTLILRLASPAVRLASGIVFQARSSARGVFGRSALEEENAELRERVDHLTLELSLLKERLLRFERGAALHEFLRGLDPGEGVGMVLPAAVIANRHWDDRARILILNRGSRVGIRPNMPVITSRGVVGKTLDVTPSLSRVLLITDRNSGLSTRIARTRAWGIISGGGPTLPGGAASLAMGHVANLEDVIADDLVVTSGMDGIFPAGYTVGMVLAVEDGPDMSKKILVAPAAEMSKLEEVLVLLKEERLPVFLSPEPGGEEGGPGGAGRGGAPR